MKSKKQSVVTTSTAKAKYTVIDLIVQGSTWLERVPSLFTNSKKVLEIILKVDNQAAIKLARNDTSGSQTKIIRTFNVISFRIW